MRGYLLVSWFCCYQEAIHIVSDMGHFSQVLYNTPFFLLPEVGGWVGAHMHMPYPYVQFRPCCQVWSLSKIVFHETAKSSMAQSFRADYMIKLDTTFKSHETKFHRVVWA